MKTTLLLLSLAFSIPTFGEELSATSKQEIAHLFSYLEKSGCEFYRNGTWAQGKEASAHLQKKYQYLLSKGMLASTESFIARAASQSSMSGKPYQVRCDTSGITDSGPWFRAELASYRKRNEASSGAENSRPKTEK